MKKIILLTLFTLFTLVSCNQNADLQSSNSSKSPTDNKQNKEKSLQWSNLAEIEGRSAGTYCRNLREGEHTDWRLPNIDELRTLIKNCPATETDGMCRVSEKNDCISESCYSKSCKGCAKKINDFNYQIPKDGFSKLGDNEKIFLWSSSELFGKDYRGWYVSFFDGGIYTAAWIDSLYVRCVR